MTGVLPQFVTMLCARVAEVLVGSAWKGLVLVACVALLLRCIPRLSAGVRSAVWAAVLLLLLLLPLLQVVLPGSASIGTEHRGIHASAGWSFLIVAAWCLLSLLRLAQLAGSAFRLRTIARRAAAVDPGEPVAALLLQGRRQVTLAVSRDVSRPSVAGFFRPQILLPAGLLEEMSAAELQHVVLHELEHLRRGDDWTNLLQKLAMALFPLHPALFWLDRRLCRERELACDDGVLRATRARKAYAACLARLAEDSMMRRGLLLALGLLGVDENRSDLSGRVHRILRSPVESMGRTQGRLATASVLACVLGGMVLLTRSPLLVSFGASSRTAVAAFNVAPATATQPVALPMGVKVIAAKAVIPRRDVPAHHQARTVPHMVPTWTVDRKASVPLRQIDIVEQMQTQKSLTVLTAWREQADMLHETLAAVADQQDTQTFQPAYAAVPVRGGWLLIKL